MFKQKRHIFRSASLWIFVALFIGSSLCWSADDQKTADEAFNWERAFIRSNMYISQMFDHAAEKIDLFLSGSDKPTKRNTTSVRIENIIESSEGVPVSSVVHFNINLRLPNLEEYWQLKFSTYDEVEEQRQRRGYLRQALPETNYGASVGLFKKLGNIRTAFQPRIELRDPLKVSHSLRFDSSAKIDNYELRPKLEFFANPDKGTGIFGAINTNIILSNYYSLAIINEGEYQEKLHLFSSNSGLALGQSISDHSSFSYNIFFSSNSRPAYHLDSYSFSVAWSEVIYKKILDYQVIPHLDFPLANSFKGSAGITILLGLNF